MVNFISQEDDTEWMMDKADGMQVLRATVLRWIVGISVLLTLVACGSDSSDSSAEEPQPPQTQQPQTGTQIDAQMGQLVSGYTIEGLKYQSGSLQGYTDAQGRFEYTAGEDVTFSIGQYVLGTVPATAQVTLASLSDMEMPEDILFQASQGNFYYREGGLSPGLSIFSGADGIDINRSQYFAEHVFGGGLVNVYGATISQQLSPDAFTTTLILALLDEDSNVSNGIVLPRRFMDFADEKQFMANNESVWDFIKSRLSANNECNMKCLLRAISMLEDVAERQFPNDAQMVYLNFPDSTIYVVDTEERMSVYIDNESISLSLDNESTTMTTTQTLNHHYDDKGYLTGVNNTHCNRYDVYGNIIEYLEWSNFCRFGYDESSNQEVNYVTYGPLNYRIHSSDDPTSLSEYAWAFHADGRVKLKTLDADADGVFEFFYEDDNTQVTQYSDSEGDGNYEFYSQAHQNGNMNEWYDEDGDGIHERTRRVDVNGEGRSATVTIASTGPRLQYEWYLPATYNQTLRIENGYLLVETEADKDNDGHYEAYEFVKRVANEAVTLVAEDGRITSTGSGVVVEARSAVDTNQDGEYDRLVYEVLACDTQSADLCALHIDYDDNGVAGRTVRRLYVLDEYNAYDLVSSSASDCLRSDCYTKTTQMEDGIKTVTEQYFNNDGEIVIELINSDGDNYKYSYSRTSDYLTISTSDNGYESLIREEYDDGELISRTEEVTERNGDSRKVIQRYEVERPIDVDGEILPAATSERRFITVSVTTFDAATQTKVTREDSNYDGTLDGDYDYFARRSVSEEKGREVVEDYSCNWVNTYNTPVTVSPLCTQFLRESQDNAQGFTQSYTYTTNSYDGEILLGTSVSATELTYKVIDLAPSN